MDPWTAGSKELQGSAIPCIDVEMHGGLGLPCMNICMQSQLCMEFMITHAFLQKCMGSLMHA